MQSTMPGLLPSAAKPTDPVVRTADLLRTANADNWQAVIDAALGILEGASATA